MVRWRQGSCLSKRAPCRAGILPAVNHAASFLAMLACCGVLISADSSSIAATAAGPALRSQYTLMTVVHGDDQGQAVALYLLEAPVCLQQERDWRMSGVSQWCAAAAGTLEPAVAAHFPAAYPGDETGESGRPSGSMNSTHGPAVAGGVP
jgi:hypothetical protein